MGSLADEYEGFSDGNTKGKRILTSAIADMSVTEVRKALQQTRQFWDEHSPDNMFHFSKPLFNGMPVEQFAFKFKSGHHMKRHKKNKSFRGSGDDDDDDDDDDEDEEEGNTSDEETRPQSQKTTKPSKPKKKSQKQT